MKKSHLWGATSACLFSLVSTSSLALSITIGTTIIVDGGAGDTNFAGGVIDFSLTGVTGTSGTYDISGTVNETVTGTTSLTSGATLTLTNLDIEALSGTVNDTIIFDSSTYPVLALPSPSVSSIDGNWTTSGSNAPATVTGGSLTLSAWNVGNWQWNASSGAGQEFVSPFSSVGVNSSSGSSFAAASTGGVIPDLITPWFGQTFTQADWTGTRGKLDFSLANSGDGLWMPTSADIVIGDVSAVPVPAAVWLFGSGLLGLVGVARRKKAA